MNNTDFFQPMYVASMDWGPESHIEYATRSHDY